MATGGTGPRRRAREIALQILIQMDVNPELDAAQAIRRYFDHLAEDRDNEPDEPQALGGVGSAAVDEPFLRELVAGVAAHRQELDEIVQNMSRNWRIERMALVDRNVIRVGLYEMRFTSSIPTNVAINEAVELTKRFGTAEGGAFVNGLLDRAASELQIRR